MRRHGRPESCTLHRDEDVCPGCPNGIPPCAGIADRSRCGEFAELAARHAAEDAATQRRGKPRGTVADAVRLHRAHRRPPRALAAPIDGSTWIATERLVADVRTLTAAVPPDVDLVAAIPRSGLMPGSLVAFHRHLPMICASRYAGLVDPGHGHRLAGRGRTAAHILLIDDTVASGKEMARNLATVRAAYPGARVTRAAVYAHPHGLGAGAVDLYVSEYPGPHLLEWNFFNTGHALKCAVDFDGILCRDPTAEECDGGPRYARFLATASPLHLPRRKPVPLIVTARHERDRAPTLAWLGRHGVEAERLVMRDFEVAGPWHRAIGAWKAGHYAASGCEFFAESDPRQAEEIHRLTGRPVLCPALGRVLGRQR